MHELAVTQSVLEIVLRHARQAGGARVSAIHLVVGQLSSIVDDSVAYYWESVARDTPAEGARLHFRRIPARFRCEACGREFPLQEETRDCPGCANGLVRLIAGDEFSVESIEVDADGVPPSGPAGG
ncbi:MAG: hydrogenase maturation nickel metallochaperone HypA [Chloroflexi bacterium]|nr:hydrogenase maturation nickel metallochaperone HypA [Chloroflexota bacterium]